MAPVRQTSREISVLWSCLQRELVGALRRNALRTQVSFITAAFLVVIAPDERTDSTAFPTIFPLTPPSKIRSGARCQLLSSRQRAH
jgi:hypothetical protein